MKRQKQKIIILFGAPGTGKGTLAKDLVSEYDFFHLSTGDVFRDHMNRETELGNKVAEIMNSGNLCSDEITSELVLSAIDSTDKDIILDGFPRTTKQVHLLNAGLNERKSKKLKFHLIPIVLTYKNRQVLVDRIITIRAKLSNRIEDQDPLIINKRIDVFEFQTAPAIELYKTFCSVEHIFSEMTPNSVFMQAKNILKWSEI